MYANELVIENSIKLFLIISWYALWLSQIELKFKQKKNNSENKPFSSGRRGVWEKMKILYLFYFFVVSENHKNWIQIILFV